MAASAIANRIEIFGTVSAETMEELAVIAVRQGVSLSAGGERCLRIEEIIRAGAAAQRNELPLVLFCLRGSNVYSCIEQLLKTSNVPYQVVAPIRRECGEYMARLFDGISEFLRPKPMERGLRFKIVAAPGSHSGSACALQAA